MDDGASFEMRSKLLSKTGEARAEEMPAGFRKVMIVCEDAETGQIWAFILQKMGLAVFLTSSLSVAEKINKEEPLDLVIIDETTPNLYSMQFVKNLRTGSTFPILLLTSHTKESDCMLAYQAGVDDCISKPVSPALFTAKVRAALRWVRATPQLTIDRMEAGGLRVDPSKRVVILNNGQQVKLSKLEFRLLHLLMQNPNRTLSREEIIDYVWGYSGEDNCRLLKPLIFRLRKKIESDLTQLQSIQSEPGVGYRFQTQATDQLDPTQNFYLGELQVLPELLHSLNQTRKTLEGVSSQSSFDEIWHTVHKAILDIRKIHSDIVQLTIAKIKTRHYSTQSGFISQDGHLPASVEYGYFALDRDWHVTDLDQTTENLLLTASEEMEGKALWEIFPELQETDLASRLENLMETNPVDEFQVKLPLAGPVNVAAFAYEQEIGLIFHK